MDDPYDDGIRRALEEMEAALERMREAETAGKITQGALKAVERALEQVRASLPPPGGDGMEKVTKALEQIAVATAVQADVAYRGDERASARTKKAPKEVQRGVDFISRATGYSPSVGREPGSFFWLDPREAQRGDIVSLSGTGDLSEVEEIRVQGVVATIVDEDTGRIDFTVPDKAEEGSAEVEVDIGGRVGAWKGELDVL